MIKISKYVTLIICRVWMCEIKDQCEWIDLIKAGMEFYKDGTI